MLSREETKRNQFIATIAAGYGDGKKIQLSNLPKVKDIETMISLLKSLDVILLLHTIASAYLYVNLIKNLITEFFINLLKLPKL